MYAVIGLLQYFLFSDLRPFFYQGWDEHLYRIFGTLFDPNFSGAIFVFGFFFSLVSVKGATLTKKSLLPILGACVCFIALLLTYSRSSYLMFGISLIVYLLYMKKTKALLILISAFLIGLALIPKNYKSEGVNLLRTASVYSRITEYKQASVLFFSSPLFGVGFNTYRYAQQQGGFINDVGTAQPWMSNHSGAGVPNSYLFVLATTGLVGFGAFILLIGVVIRDIFTSKREKSIKYAMLALFCGLLVHAFFENSLFYPFILIYLVSFSAYCED
jgi:O-antigen ligase